MRTNVEIDDALIARVMAATGLPSKRAAVDAGLRALLRLAEQSEILSLAGQVRWEGDLDAVREGRRAGEEEGGVPARSATEGGVIVVDSSVWIDHLNDRATPEVRRLRGLVGRAAILVGDLILLEVLQGLRDEREAALVERALRQFDVVAMLDPNLAARAAANYRRLRSLGATVRKTADLVIGTFCVERGHALLHSDRDFLPMQAHLGLRAVPGVGGP